MGKLAVHGHSFKAGAIGGIDKHNERLSERHSNEDIDSSRTHLNMYFCKPDKTLYQDCKKEVEKIKSNGGRLRSDQNWITEFITYAPKGLSYDEYKRYFDEVHKFFGEKIGYQNIKLSVVHMDEVTPHMHLDFMPIVRNEAGEPVKLSSKEVVTRKLLFSIHDELPKRLQALGFDVQRGNKVTVEDKPLKGRSVKQYKADKEREKRELEKQIEGMAQVKGQLQEDIKYLEEKKSNLLDDLVSKIERKQEHIKKNLSYEIQKTGMFSNRKDRAVWIELEVLDKLLSLDKDWHELKEHVKLVKSQNSVLKEENAVYYDNLHKALEERNLLAEVLKHELPERDLSVLISECKERRAEKMKTAFAKEDTRIRSRLNLKREEPGTPVVKSPVKKEGLLPKKKSNNLER